MATYDSNSHYINCAKDLKDKIDRIDNIIDALFDTALKSADGDNISEYQLDDGQTKIRTTYKGTDQIFKSIEVLEKTKQLYINRLSGRAIRLLDARAIRRRY